MTLAQAKKQYQEEVANDFALARLHQASTEYQQAMATEFEKVAVPAAGVSAKKPKVRVQFPAASGRSVNGFLMKSVTGQIDQAVMDGKRVNGSYPTAEQVAALTGIPVKRVAEHIKYWQTKKI